MHRPSSSRARANSIRPDEKERPSVLNSAIKLRFQLRLGDPDVHPPREHSPDCTGSASQNARTNEHRYISIGLLDRGFVHAACCDFCALRIMRHARVFVAQKERENDERKVENDESRLCRCVKLAALLCTVATLNNNPCEDISRVSPPFAMFARLFPRSRTDSSVLKAQ
ncbi:uncharacterized protein LOC109859175 [Pseudomyrmex gracilis]|uniref:uncharacterized protein LOC109859175 n=1 Tax=Pseudomyrmex gracilis TaxID=219809 RepID=UPI000994F04E|nr:uncharacterized protein LOC109859175 [Pseudomyrmex gracilis]